MVFPPLVDLQLGAVLHPNVTLIAVQQLRRSFLVGQSSLGHLLMIWIHVSILEEVLHSLSEKVVVLEVIFGVDDLLAALLVPALLDLVDLEDRAGPAGAGATALHLDSSLAHLVTQRAE